ncbi:MAG: hypothetical protein IPQ09_08460 [Myxococcales bacterium]|nr:hypothetical protein [Myxococcales bacterium]
MTERARELRRTQTRSETVLWEALRASRAGGGLSRLRPGGPCSRPVGGREPSPRPRESRPRAPHPARRGAMRPPLGGAAVPIPLAWVGRSTACVSGTSASP